MQSQIQKREDKSEKPPLRPEDRYDPFTRRAGGMPSNDNWDRCRTSDMH